ncbi:MAG TPA: hypothetical protein DCP32_15020 [Anaerolineaceae bacterium]|nr:hypothetical protein [Anaerolineaceae bacterium]HBA91417.1 hypothetical protein [Anaerolineaceae bacterium]
MAAWTNFIPLVLVIAGSLSLLWTNKWRYNIAAIALQYLAVFWFVSQVWPIGLAAIKLVAGWMAGAVLAASVTASGSPELDPPAISARIFRAAGGVFVLILAFSVAPATMDWIPVHSAAMISSLVLIGMGLLQLSMTKDSLRVTLGLLMTLSGFEIIYAAAVTSVLLAGLLALVTIGVSLTGAYWLSLTAAEEPV